MVAFATIFLGLVLGNQVVELAVDGPVAAVEIRLDGEVVAARSEPPWLFVIDFGSGYEPHVLEAVARDDDGQELSRAEQWLNVPRREVEAEIVLKGGRDGTGVVAKVLWESRVEALPEEIRVTFDGRPLNARDPERIPLPSHDPDQLHLLQVELRFRGNYSTTAEKIFGGTYADEVEARLTAVPIALAKGVRAPEAASVRDRFVGADGDALEVVAVDEGPAELIVVRDAAAQERINAMFVARRNRTVYHRTGGGQIVELSTAMRHTGQLRRNQIVRFLYPFTVELLGHRTRQEQFPTSRAYPPSEGGLVWLMAGETRPFEHRRQRLAEAVAVAGMAAAMRNRRRAVLLVIAGGDSTDISRIDPRAARRYLASLRVPLTVWAVGETGETGPWGPQEPVQNLAAMNAATRELARSLERQRIVWLRGRHLPQKIGLLERADFTLAR